VKGFVAVFQHKYKAEILSLLPDFTIDVYIACNVYRGGVIKEIFAAFIEHEVFLECGEFLGPYPL
jgi:hypothetical protein